RGSTGWDWRASHNLNLSNRPVRTRMPGGVAGERPMKAVPYADARKITLRTCILHAGFFHGLQIARLDFSRDFINH
ncbi:hypothetical protein, partial [Pseudomonas arcuscaelestis]|uniref:hypothetical protein n=1 Tax=Pseudomonas arcuscaelestis TaxID=2710591 RepID=UPI00193D09D4